jgi:hypothetical protein
MPSQIFQAPVGQVAAGNIHNNQSKWDHHSLQELKHLKSAYAKERTKVWFAQYVNRYAAGLLIVLALMGAWGGYMIQSGGLVGAITPDKMAILAAFAVSTLALAFGLHRLRVNAQATLVELDDDLKGINQAIRYKKSAQKRPL